MSYFLLVPYLVALIKSHGQDNLKTGIEQLIRSAICQI